MQNLIKTSRILLAVMFLFSGISKLISLPFFDSMVAEIFLGKDYYDNAAGLYLTQILSRVLIAAEMLLGAAVLQEKWLKKLIIPSLFGMLLLFTVHLFYEGLTSEKGFIEGNCGCFGDVLPMNNLESIIKNAAAMVLAALVFFGYKQEEEGMKIPSLWGSIVLSAVTLGTLWLTIKHYETSEPIHEDMIQQTPMDTSLQTQTDSAIQNTPLNQSKDTASGITQTVKVGDNKAYTPAEMATHKLLKTSGRFSDGTFLQADKGNKLVCLFSMTCGHCQEVYKEMCGFSQYASLPAIYLLNFGKEFEQNYFFNQAGNCRHPHWRTEDYPLFKRMLEGESFPRILHMKDGKILQTWNIDTYKKEAFMKYFNIVEKKKDGGLQLEKPGSGWEGGEKKPWE
jgi:uncharacterized membrane protein YphA (DoxX/SURF4 family)